MIRNRSFIKQIYREEYDKTELKGADYQKGVFTVAVDAGKKSITYTGLLKLLDFLYGKALKGIPHVSSSVEELAESYLKDGVEPEKASRRMLRGQIAKCTVSGVITGIGGFSTLPVSVPANVASILYMQLRMIACTARMAGFEPSDPTVRAYAFACLGGVSIRTAGESLQDLRKKSALRMLAKTGERGVLNLAKLIPLVGAGINGGIDYAGARAAAKRAYQVFFRLDLTIEEEKSLFRRGEELYRKIYGK